jgi:hypothetical protein
VAFPTTQLPVAVELQLNGTWTDITSKVYVRDPITIKRGRSSEGQNVDPSTCQLTLDNRGGTFSPRNPTGPYYGTLGRNTPLRVSVTGMDDNSLQTTGSLAGIASTPTATALNTTADLDLRVEVTPFNLYGASQDWIGKWDPTGGQASYVLWNDNVGNLYLSWTTGGTSATQVNVQSTAPVPRDNSRRFAVRASLTVATGTVTFYYADSIAGTWLQLGDAVVVGATSVFASTAALRLAKATTSGTSVAFLGRIYKAQVRTGAGAATLVANPDFTAQTAGATSFTDSTGKLWTVGAPATITSKSIRFIGEVSTWPVKWDQGEDDLYVPVTASGILRRLQANTPPLRSVLRRSIPGIGSQLRAYWPMEDQSGATSLAYGLTDLTGTLAMALTNGPSLASYSGFAASDDIPTFSNGSSARGRVPTYTSTGQVQLRFLLALPSTGQPANGTMLAKLQLSFMSWQINYQTGGNLQVVVTDVASGAVVHTSAVMGTGLDGKAARISLELKQNGGSIDWSLGYYVPNSANAIYFNWPGALTSTVGAATYVQVGATGANSSVSIGHVTVESAVTSMFDIVTQINAYQGESSVTRAYRLATEEGYPLYYQGPTTTLMGPQTSDSLIDLLRQCADANLGILYEPRGVFALAFRPRVNMYARDAAVTLDYSAGHLSAFEPVEDDQAVTNDVVLQRTTGSSYEASLDTGTLSTLAPPNGIGKYTQAVKLNLAADSQLREQANFRLALGTIDEPRYPVIGVELERSPFASSLALTRAVLDADLGDVLQVNTPPGFYAPQTVFQRIEGATEVLEPYGYTVAFNCSPGSPWRGIGVYNDPTNRTRYDTDASTLTSTVTATATSLSATTTDGAVWTTTPADIPFQILVGGEVMTVTAVTGSSSPQTLTVTRSVNGVSKAQTAGTPIHVYTPAYYGF